MGSGPSGNPPLHINILYCMLLMCLQVVNKRSLSLSLSLSSPFVQSTYSFELKQLPLAGQMTILTADPQALQETQLSPTFFINVP